ncbi:unnamed protein product [Lupinus luteus]|uniref:Uncharacterized protein n=1 Tax=Lupinus luteus TaxID=3873 RepID=A0AAV1WNX6_LUPLU
MHGYLTDKADVYSFGVVALEIVSGKNNTIRRQNEDALLLLDWTNQLKEEGNLMELVDKRLGSDFNKEEAMVMINVALLCTNVTQTLRPAMSSVVSMLEGRSVVHEVVSESRDVFDEKMEAMRLYCKEIQEHSSISMEVPWTASSASAADLYPVHSSYLEERN